MFGKSSRESSFLVFCSVCLSVSLFVSLPFQISLFLCVYLSMPPSSLALLFIYMSLLLDLKWPASIPADTVTSWWKSSLSSVIVSCGADRHRMGVNTSFKLLWFSCSSHQTELCLTFLNTYSHTGSHFISLPCSQKSIQVEKKLLDFYLWCLCLIWKQNVWKENEYCFFIQSTVGEVN